jgi:serine phosphatase RsbU (regulator of sigma subunit)
MTRSNNNSEFSRLQQENLRLNRALEELSILNEIAVDISSALSLDRILESIVRKCTKHLKTEQVVVLLLDEKEKENPLRTLIRGWDTTADSLPYRLDTHLTGWMLKNRMPLLINDFKKDTRFRAIPGETPLIHSLLSVPLLLKNRMIGLIAVFNKKTGHGFSNDDQRLLSIIGSQSAQVITNALMYDELQKHREHLEELVKERTSELKDKNEKIMSGIDYAQRLQLSILPREEKICQYVSQYFITWKPSETVGGDFYWFYCVEDPVHKCSSKNFLLAVVDCTGHGVPGAFMTMTANSVLNHIAYNICNNDPAKILQELNRIIHHTLNQDTPTALSDDGLDIGLCFVNFDEKKLIYAGAKLSLFYCTGQNIIEIKGNRQSIGYKRSKQDYQYTNHEIQLEGDEVFYITTDGYLHQNGEKDDRKFGKERFKEMIRENHKKPLSMQKEIIETTLVKYMGKEPQRDDITVIGFKL